MPDNETVKYFNDMLYRLEALLYHEIAGTAIKKVDLVGTDFLQSKGINGKGVEELIDKCIRELVTKGLVRGIHYSIHGYGILLKLEVDGCIHIPKEARLKSEGFNPIMCPIANMIGDRIIEVLDYETTYMADMVIDENNGKCTVKYGIFENIDKIGQVCDWTEI